MKGSSERNHPKIVPLREDKTYLDHGVLRLCSPDDDDDIVFGGLAGGESIVPHVVLKDGITYLRIPLSFTRSGRGRHFLAGKEVSSGSKWRWAVNDIEIQGRPRDSFESNSHEAAYLNAPALFLFPDDGQPIRTCDFDPIVLVGELALHASPSGRVKVVNYRNSLCFRLTEYTQFFYRSDKGKKVPTPLQVYCDPLRTIIYTPAKLRLRRPLPPKEMR